MALDNIAATIEAEVKFLRTWDRQLLISIAFQMLRYAAVCTKHPGFKEEREWRLVYCPPLERSEYLVKEVRTITGTPQHVYKVPLKDIPEKGFVGIEIPALLNRIIIGPSRYPLAMLKAFVELLTAAGVQNAHERVSVSDIPLRR